MVFQANEKASRFREAFSTSSPQKATGLWRCGPYFLNYRKRPLVMGILNITPDSFSDGGLFLDPKKAVDHALRMEEEGADLIDVGGESTRPGALPVPPEEEMRRVLPIIERLMNRLKIPLSIDTTKSEVAKRAIDAGVSVINDVSGLTRDPEMFSVAAKGKTGLIIMHSKGTPQTMQRRPRYRDLIGEIHRFLDKQVQKAMNHKIPRNRIVIDPGIGFGKTAKHNLKILRHLDLFTDLGVPVMVGPSRKSFIGQALNLPATERLEGTAAAAAIAVFQGARIFRVHDVKALARVIRVADVIHKEAFI